MSEGSDRSDGSDQSGQSDPSNLCLAALLGASEVARDFLVWMEVVGERLAPERSLGLAEQTATLHGEALRQARTRLDACPPPEELRPFIERFNVGFTHLEQAYDLFTQFPTAAPPERIPRILGALHHGARALETFYLLRAPLPAFRDFWQPLGTDADDPPPRAGDASSPPTGVIHVSAGGSHGGFSLFVPEIYQPDRAWPVIVALHGGSGNGRDFLWTWVREAKSRSYILLAPTAAGDTWGESDDRGLLEILTWLGRRYRIDDRRILLTGLSDGATFTLLYGLAHPNVYRALAPLCGVLHPANEAIGNLGRAKDRPIYLVHGALDFLFPVDLARYAHSVLAQAGAAVTYREIEELSHTYPRSENVRILDWFESLPE